MRIHASSFPGTLSATMIALSCAFLTACGGGSSSSSTSTSSSVPGAPTIGTATPASGSITIPYTAPSSDGGSAITGYTASCTPSGGTAVTATGTAGSTSIVLSSLTNDTAYSCYVTAKNTIGTGSASSTISVTPSATVKAPSAPTNVTATFGDGSASVAFTAPGSNGGAPITDYTATCTTSGSSGSGRATTSPVTVSSLTNGTTYTCLVAANNTIGAGTASSSTSVTPSAAITAKYSSLNTEVGSSSVTSYTALSGTSSTSTSTAGVGCGAAGSGTTATGVVSANNTSNITSAVTNNYNYTWTCSGTSRTLAANGIPNHAVGVFPNSGNPNTIATQTVSGSATLTPTLASTANYNVQPPGYGINGIKFDANTGGSCANSATSADTTGTSPQCSYNGNLGTWGLEALPSVTPFDFGADSNLAHVQPGGAYHYHGAPARLFAALGGTIDSSTGVANKMVLIGWGLDGFPMYYKYGYSTAGDSTSALKALRGNYLPNSTDTTNVNRPSLSVFPLGTFKNDWAYSASNGGDLDECNGRTGVTPEFPNGIYYYVVTDTYPYAPRCLKGNYTSSSGNTPPAR